MKASYNSDMLSHICPQSANTIAPTYAYGPRALLQRAYSYVYDNLVLPYLVQTYATATTITVITGAFQRASTPTTTTVHRKHSNSESGRKQSNNTIYGRLPAVKNLPHTLAFHNYDASTATYDQHPAPTPTTTDSTAVIHNTPSPTQPPPTPAETPPTTDDDLHYYGYRYYSPELGRWVSRYPIGERGGKNLNAASLNDSLNQNDALGLAITESTCKRVIDGFWLRNRRWKDKVDDFGSGTPSCKLDLECRDCSCDDTCGTPGWEFTGCCYGREPIEGGVEIKVLLCSDRLSDRYAQVALAHELTHFFDKCNRTDMDCSEAADTDYMACRCGISLCRELRAHRASNECRSFESCWNMILSRGYYHREWRCGSSRGAAPDRVKAYLRSNCDWDPGLPPPRWDPVLPPWIEVR